ncbi:hypothetical protein [Streptomyces lycii]|uniref:DUF3117 domain-containing protein n=1 Tax=Streptomyces lycii TaxID=2654337 RepID=A0ABQ7FJR7_9ACTN|nr:hypothetical protein [Streptomyces lycii]KAF4408620.1 hypothetical protein GCU69_13050 [Streptomyces lycii]
MELRSSTYDGGTVDLERAGHVFLLHTRGAAGRTVCTVEMPEDDARGLLGELVSEVDSYECGGCGDGNS